MKSIVATFFVSAFLAFSGTFAQSIEVDQNIPTYRAVSGVSGNLNSVGSDTLNNLMTLWSEEFGRIYTAVNVQIEGKGSGTAPPALIAGISQLGPCPEK